MEISRRQTIKRYVCKNVLGGNLQFVFTTVKETEAFWRTSRSFLTHEHVFQVGYQSRNKATALSIC